MADSCIIARYRIETCLPVGQVAETIAGEQSSGTFLPVPGETEELKARSRAKVRGVALLDAAEQPSLPGGRRPSAACGPVRFQRAEITLEFPLANLGANLPTLVATVCGNLHELSEHTGSKLLDLELPAAFGEKYPGPQFGVAGTRRLAGVFDRPIIGTIVKPSVGFTADQTADLVRELGEAGIDFIKDDELQADGPHCPLKDRAVAVMRVINQLPQRTGRKVMVAFNITDDLDAMLRHHDTVMPVVSSGQWGGQAPDTYRLTGTTDLMYVAGGGIMAHPLGPAAGVRSLQQAWEAAVQGIDLNTYAERRAEPRETTNKFGGRK